MTKICPNCGLENENYANFCKSCGTKLVVEKTKDTSNLNQNDGINNWVIIFTAIAISLIFIFAGVGIINQHSESNSVTNANGNGNNLMGSNLIIHNGTWGSTIQKGDYILVQLKDSNWDAMEGCLVSISLENKKTGDQYDGECTIGEDSYAYVGTEDLPLGEYEIYAEYYGDEEHYGANYTDSIEIID